MTNYKTTLPSADQALPGRLQPMVISNVHFVHQTNLQAPFAENLSQALFGMGCFWGAEKLFWSLEGVYSTAVGYSAGHTANPNYQEVCSGQTGHNEVVLVLFDEQKISYQKLLETFWQGHNPTQGMGQGNDRGTQYRSGIYTFNDQQYAQAVASLRQYQNQLSAAGLGGITTEILPAPVFYYAEEDHQQYLAKQPQGYCGLGGTGVALIKC